MEDSSQQHDPREALISQERWATEPGLEGLVREIAALMKGRDSFEIAQVLIELLIGHAGQSETALRDPAQTQQLLTTYAPHLASLDGRLRAQGAGLGQILLLHGLSLRALFQGVPVSQR